jgi:TolB-like protein
MSWRHLGWILLPIALVTGCSASAPRDQARVPVVAVLPFENLAVSDEGSRVVTRVCQGLVAQREEIRAVEPGEVEEALIDLRIRVPALMTEEQRRALRDTLHCDYVFTGTLLTYGHAEHPYAGKVGVVSLTAQIMQLVDAKVVWAETVSRQGSDSQWIFGLGTKHDPAILAEEICRSLVNDAPWGELHR